MVQRVHGFLPGQPQPAGADGQVHTIAQRGARRGIAGGKGKGLLFRKGEPLYPVTGGREELLEALMREVALLLEEKRSKQ